MSRHADTVDGPAPVPASRQVITNLAQALEIVAQKKADLDALATQVEAASAAYQQAIATATALHESFTAHVGGLIPIAR